MSHEYSDITEVRVDSTGYQDAELPVDGTQRPELAPGVQHTIGTVAITEVDGAAPMHYIQDALDTGLKPPLFPTSEMSKVLRKQNNSSVAERHPEDMEREI